MGRVHDNRFCRVGTAHFMCFPILDSFTNCSIMFVSKNTDTGIYMSSKNKGPGTLWKGNV